MSWGDAFILILIGAIFLIILVLTGCAKRCPQHSCPETGHGPCYICDDPKYKIKYGRHNILNK